MKMQSFKQNKKNSGIKKSYLDIFRQKFEKSYCHILNQPTQVFLYTTFRAKNKEKNRFFGQLSFDLILRWICFILIETLTKGVFRILSNNYDRLFVLKNSNLKRSWWMFVAPYGFSKKLFIERG